MFQREIIPIENYAHHINTAGCKSNTSVNSIFYYFGAASIAGSCTFANSAAWLVVAVDRRTIFYIISRSTTSKFLLKKLKRARAHECYESRANRDEQPGYNGGASIVQRCSIHKCHLGENIQFKLIPAWSILSTHNFGGACGIIARLEQPPHCCVTAANVTFILCSINVSHTHVSTQIRLRTSTQFIPFSVIGGSETTLAHTDAMPRLHHKIVWCRSLPAHKLHVTFFIAIFALTLVESFFVVFFLCFFLFIPLPISMFKLK